MPSSRCNKPPPTSPTVLLGPMCVGRTGCALSRARCHQMGQRGGTPTDGNAGWEDRSEFRKMPKTVLQQFVTRVGQVSHIGIAEWSRAPTSLAYLRPSQRIASSLGCMRPLAPESRRVIRDGVTVPQNFISLLHVPSRVLHSTDGGHVVGKI